MAPDAMQVVLGQALRALGDAWIAIIVYFVAFVAVMIPLADWLLTGQGMDERGLVVAIIVCCVIAVFMLGARFLVVSRRGW